MNSSLEYSKGITLISLVVTIIVLLIITGITIAMLTQNNGLINKTAESAILTEVGQIREAIALKSLENNERFTGKLSEIENLKISQNLINKYNNILYIKDSNLYLNYIAGFPKIPEYIANKNIITILKESMEICYDNLKSYNKLSNPYFDDGLNNYQMRSTKGNVTEIRNEDGNNYLHMEMYVSSGNTQWVMTGNSKVANNYGEVCYAFIKYRNSYVPSEDGFVINNDIITLSRYGRGYDTPLLNKTNFIKSYNSGWNYVSSVRKIISQTTTLGLLFTLGGGVANGQKQEYSIDFDDLYMINLTELFGEGNEPSKEEMDAIFKNF